LNAFLKGGAKVEFFPFTKPKLTGERQVLEGFFDSFARYLQRD